MRLQGVSMKMAILGDPHIGHSYHFGHTLDNNFNSRLVDYQKTLRFAIDGAASAGCKAFAITGDLFKNCRPGTVEQDIFWSELTRGYKEHGIIFYIVAGNHDMPSYCRKTVQSIATKLNEYTYVKSCDHICSIDFPQDDTTLVMVPFFNRVTEKAETNQAILDFIAKELDVLEPLGNTIAIWHGLSEGTYLANYTGLEVDALAEPVIPLSMSQRFNVCAFGHVHRFGEIKRTPDSVVINVGSMEVNDFTDSAQDKFMVIVNTSKKGKNTKLDVNYVKLPVVKAETIKVAMSGSVHLESIDKIKVSSVKDKIVRIQIETDEETMSTFNDSDMKEFIEGLGAYKYMGTSFRLADKDESNKQHVDMANHGDVTMDSIRGFLAHNKLPFAEETISYAKEIISKVDGDAE